MIKNNKGKLAMIRIGLSKINTKGLSDERIKKTQKSDERIKLFVTFLRLQLKKLTTRFAICLQLLEIGDVLMK